MPAPAGALALALLGAACAGRVPAPPPAAAPVATPVAAPAAAPAAPAAAAARGALRAALDSLVGDAQWRTAHWGVLIVNPRTGDTLYSRNAGKLFMPASNQKIVTGAAALAVLGAGHRWRTTFAARGPVRDGVLRGDLVVIGRGDPTVSDRMRGDAMAPLRAVADSLAARGVRRITGRVVADTAALPGPALGFGWSWDDLDEPYAAGVGALLFNEGFSRVTVRGAARAGVPASVVTAPAPGVPSLVGAVTTVAPPFAPSPPGSSATRVGVRWDPAAGAYRLDGTIVAGDSVGLELAHRDPAAAYVAALVAALRARGIAVDEGRAASGARAARDDARPADGVPPDTLFAILSPTLGEALPAMEKPSQNQIAELVFRTLGLERAGVGSADSARRVLHDQLRAWGVEPERDVVVRDGSGLSRHDYVTPTALVRILAAVRARPDGAAFVDALPAMGVDGTLASRLRGTAAAGRVRAKTGYIDRARTLSGYATTADGETLVFSLLCNNYTAPTRAVEAAQDAIVARLATMPAR